MKQKIIGILYCVLQAAAGILLLVNPVSFTSLIIVAVGAFLTVVGVVGIIKYFKTPVNEASKSQSLTKGILTTLVGLFCMLGSNWLIATIPLVTAFYGIVMLVIGASKIQLVIDAARRKENWLWQFISAAITIICAFIILKNPFSTTAVLWMFTGISLIVDAIFDLIAIIFVKKLAEEATKGKGTIEGKAVEKNTADEKAAETNDADVKPEDTAVETGTDVDEEEIVEVVDATEIMDASEDTEVTE